MYIYLDKQGIVKEIINDEALRQSASNVNEIYVYYEGLQENDIGSVLATYGLPDGTITDEMEVATRTEESEIPYDAERDLKYFKYYQAYPFYHFAIADLALSQEGVVRLMIRLAQKDGEYIKVAGLVCFDVEGELVKEDHGVSLAQYNYLIKAWVNANGFLPLDGSKAMQGNLDMGAHNVLLNGKTIKDNNGALNYNGSDLAKQSDTSSLQSQIDTINATQNVVDIVGTKAELNAYATNDLHANDKIEVLADESQNNANTIYEWNGNAWSLVGSKAPYYSKAESDARYNELKAKSYDKDTASYVSGHVPDSALVKGSLDSVNEKVGALQADNQTTKTTIAGLVSSDTTNKTNIAKNTQDIENLSAVMPTDINVDANGYAILEHDGTEITGQTKKVKFAQPDKPASFSEVTIPTASALKTKDGTSFGGGDTSSIPTDINVDSNYNLILEHDGTEITGQKKNVKAHWDFDNRYSTIFDYQISSIIVSRIDNKIQKGNIVMGQGSYDSGQKRSDSFIKIVPILYNEPSKNSQYGMFNYNITSNQLEITNYSGQGNFVTSLRIPLPSQLKKVTITVPAEKNGTIALVEDLATKQDKRFVHTVEIHYASNGSYFCFTGTSDKNTPIDSVQDLTTVFANRDLCGVGVFGSAGLSKIHVGSSVNDTTFKKYMNNGEYTNPSEETFAMVFNTTGFNITDVVTPL